MQSGHYVAFIRVGGDFWLFDDDKVRPVIRDLVLSHSPYMLYYQVRLLRVFSVRVRSLPLPPPPPTLLSVSSVVNDLQPIFNVNNTAVPSGSLISAT